MATAINPQSCDYERGSDGRLLRDPVNGMRNAIHLRLRTPLGSYWANPTLGSRLHELRKDVSRAKVLARQYTETALKDLCDSGKISLLTLNVTQSLRGQILISGEAHLATGEQFPFQHFVKIG